MQNRDLYRCIAHRSMGCNLRCIRDIEQLCISSQHKLLCCYSTIAQSFGSIRNLHLHLQVCLSCLLIIAQSTLQTAALSKGEWRAGSVQADRRTAWTGAVAHWPNWDSEHMSERPDALSRSYKPVDSSRAWSKWIQWLWYHQSLLGHITQSQMYIRTSD
jgi:hypothetical protein